MSVLGSNLVRACCNGLRRGTRSQLKQIECVYLPCHMYSSSYLSDPGNTGKQTSGVNFDILGSWNNRLNLKIDMEESIRRGKLIPKIDIKSVGISSLQGHREYNEDRMVSMELKPNILMFGLFDGHGGKQAVEYVVDNLPNHIRFWLDRNEGDLEDVLKRAFIEVNNSFTKYLYQNLNKAIEEGMENPMSGGTTATVCLVKNGVQLVVAHVGDSRAVLCRSNKACRLTQDHDPKVDSERERILKCNGHFSSASFGKSRVNGRLEMTRSIGDVELKPYGVIAEPEVRTIEIRHGSDSFLLLTTDGIHNQLNSSEMVQLVSSCISTDEAARFLTDQALFYGSQDNCSAVIIPLGAWGKFTPAERQIFFSQTRNPAMFMRTC